MEWEIVRIRSRGLKIEREREFFTSIFFNEEWTQGRGYEKGRSAFASRPFSVDDEKFLAILREELKRGVEVEGDPIPAGRADEAYEKSFSLSSKEAEDIIETLRASVEKKPMMRIEKLFLIFERREVEIRNSRALNRQGACAGIRLGGAVIADDGKEAQVNYDVYHFSSSEVDVEKVAEELSRPARMLLKSKKPPTGRFPCVLLNRVMCELLEGFILQFTAESLFRKKTLLEGREGEKVFSEVLSIEENNPAFPEPLHLPFDGEGVRKKHVLLVQDGIFRSFLFNTMYGNIYKREPAGSSRLRPSSPPSLTGSSILLKPGELSFENLVGKMGRGCVITGIIGGHTLNPITGEFSVGASGFYMENGNSHPFCGGVISGNLFELLKKVEAVGKDVRTMGWITSPSLLVSEINTGGKDGKG